MNKNTKNKAGKEHNQQAQVAESSTPSCQFENEREPEHDHAAEPKEDNT